MQKLHKDVGGAGRRLGQALSTGQSCEHAVWRTFTLQRASCKALGYLWGLPGRLLDAFWVLSEASWKLIKASRLSLASWSRPARVLEPLVSMAVTSQALLEPSGRRHKLSWTHPKGVLGALGAIWEAS